LACASSIEATGRSATDCALLKRIGTITFSDERPRDFWAERGYDWYAGH
jgi:hypothetical protein